MLNWEWQTTKLQPSFTKHGMFSGTGFITLDKKPAIIYHGENTKNNFVIIAKNNQLSKWNKPLPINKNKFKINKYINIKIKMFINMFNFVNKSIDSVSYTNLTLPTSDLV